MSQPIIFSSEFGPNRSLNMLNQGNATPFTLDPTTGAPIINSLQPNVVLSNQPQYRRTTVISRQTPNVSNVALSNQHIIKRTTVVSQQIPTFVPVSPQRIIGQNQLSSQNVTIPTTIYQNSSNNNSPLITPVISQPPLQPTFETNLTPIVIAGQSLPIGQLVSTTPVLSPVLIESKSAPSVLRNPGDLAITSNILADNQRNRAMASTPESISNIKRFQKQQQIMEERYLKDGAVCPINQLKKLRDRLGTLDSKEFKTLLRNKFYDPEVMKSAMCATESITYMPPVEPGNVASNIRIKRWLHNLRRIGAESVEGYAMGTDLGLADDTFIIKAPRDPENPVLLHEYFVGIYGLNKLRKQVPNFAYIMGGFRCSLPVIDNNKSVVAWCNNTNYPIDYVIYENITPGKTLSEVITGPMIGTNTDGSRRYDSSKGCEFTEWLNYYMQILYALKIAHKEVDYTHYDLHTENVIIREVPQGANGKKFKIPYVTENRKTEYLVTGKVATVIDYGLSHIKYEGRGFGVADRVPWGVQAERSFEMHDAYKLLMMSMRDMYLAKREGCLNMASNILKFFNASESVQEIITNQAKTYYYLPYNDLTASLTFDDLTRYIRNIFDTRAIISPIATGAPILGCQGNDICINSDDFLTQSGLESIPQARTVFDFYDLASRLTTEKRDNERKILKDGFNWKEAKGAAIGNYNYIVSKLSALLDGGTYGDTTITPLTINRIYSTTQQLSNLFSSTTLQSYKNYIYRLAEIYETMQNASILHRALVYTANEFNDNTIAQQIEASYKQLRTQFTQKWLTIISFVKQDINYTRVLLSNPNNATQINQQIAANPQYSWWWRFLPEILQVVDEPIQ